MDDKDSVFKVGDFLFAGDKDLIFDFYNNSNPHKKIKSKGDTIYYDKDITILADYKKVNGFVYKKINLKYNFDMFKVKNIYKGPLAKPNLETDPASYEYQTMIRNYCAQDSINFAGHYSIAEWGCGQECGMMAVVDRLNGRVYYSPKYLAFDTADGHWGIEYRKDSRMIIVNSHLVEDYPGYSLQNWRHLGIYKWNGNRFVKLQ